MSVENFLTTLNKVRRTGPDRWIACCPAHDDKHPSMTVSIGRNGGVIVKCHAQGCSFQEIVEASGVDPAEMFPPKSQSYDYRSPERRPLHAEDALKALAHEATVIYLILSDVVKHHREAGFTNADMALVLGIAEPEVERLLLAAGRLNRGVELATGSAIQIKEEARLVIEAAKLRPQEEQDLAEYTQ